jgi:hypothetical protein
MLLLAAMTFIGTCPEDGLQRDVYEMPLPEPQFGAGLHVVMQSPWMQQEQRVDGLMAQRERDYLGALLATLAHPHVLRVHVLTESVAHQTLLYERVPPDLQEKMRTFNIHKRLSFADGVRYSNRYLINTSAVLCNADVSIHGAFWDRLSVARLGGHLLALTRYEQAGCAHAFCALQKW